MSQNIFRMMMKTRSRKLLCALLMMCSAGAVQVAHAAGAIKAGTYPSYPPLDMRDTSTNALTGFDIELGKALSAKMGRDFDWVETSYSELIAATKTGRVDIFFNGMFDTVEREQQISFVDYLRSGSQFMTLTTSAAKTPLDLCGKKVGISRMTSAPAVLARWNELVCEKAGKPASVYMPAENSIDARSQMKQGRVDAVMMDSLTIPYVITQDKSLTTVGEPLEYNLMGIGVAKGQEALSKQLATALQSLIDDGTYGKLLVKWGLPASSALKKTTVNGAAG